MDEIHKQTELMAQSIKEYTTRKILILLAINNIALAVIDYLLS